MNKNEAIMKLANRSIEVNGADVITYDYGIELILSIYDDLLETDNELEFLKLQLKIKDEQLLKKDKLIDKILDKEINRNEVQVHKNQSEIQFEGLCAEDEKVMEGLGG